MMASSSSIERVCVDWFVAWKPLWQHALLLGLGAAWGLQFVLLKIATNAGLGEVNTLFMSMMLLTMGFLAAMAVARAWFRPTWRHVRFFMISGLLGFVLPLGGIILAAREISAGVIVLFEALTPVFTIAIALMFLTEAITTRRALAIMFGLLGVFCVLASAVMNPGSISLLGIGFALTLPFVYALECVYVAARWPGDLRPLQIVTGEAIAGLFLFLPYLALMEEAKLPVSPWTTGHWAIFFVLISFLEAYLYFYLIRQAGAVFVSLACLVSMFAGILFGIVLIGESHPMSVWLAIGLATLALYSSLSKRGSASIEAGKDKAATF